jgi:polyphosphate kinase
MGNSKFIPRDISWLSFNARVLQEANDPSVELKQRIRFLGIFSNNMDEFFRVRVATLKRMTELGKKNMHIEENPRQILDDIQVMVLTQQSEFTRIWESIQVELRQNGVYLISETELDEEQQQYVRDFFEREVRSNVIPLLIEGIPHFPYLREKSLYLGVVMHKKATAYERQFALVEVPSKAVGRFVLLPSTDEKKYIILLEDVIRFNLSSLFSYFGYDQFSSHVFKITKDAELDLDNDVSTSLIQKIEKGLKNRRQGKTTRFVYDKEMDAALLEYLIRKLALTRKDNIIPGGRIHNFRHFMDFPEVLSGEKKRHPPLQHPELMNRLRVTDVVLTKDILLNFPYHSFDPLIDLLREAAMDTAVVQIKITAYRLASNSKVVNALVNAARNGKEVIVALELKARFDEEANLEWKERLELEGVKVIISPDNLKVHAKICVIRKKSQKKILQYGFVSTGNLNEQTAKVYGDHCLLTSNRQVMADCNKIFDYLANPRLTIDYLKRCQTLLVSPVSMRSTLMDLINREIKAARQKKIASITIKLNSISDHQFIEKLYEAANAGVEIKMIIRGIFCVLTDLKKTKNHITAISIVDAYLEHARVMIFHNGGRKKVFLSSADWMVRNLDHRIEAAVQVKDENIARELLDILDLQLSDNIKARILDSELSNNYVQAEKGAPHIRSQEEIYSYLKEKQMRLREGSGSFSSNTGVLAGLDSSSISADGQGET